MPFIKQFELTLEYVNSTVTSAGDFRPHTVLSTKHDCFFSLSAPQSEQLGWGLQEEKQSVEELRPQSIRVQSYFSPSLSLSLSLSLSQGQRRGGCQDNYELV